MGLVLEVLCLLLGVYYVVLLAYIVFSFVPNPPEPLRPLADGTRRLVDPVVRPIRQRLSPVPVGAVQLDLSILVVFIGLALLRALVC